MTKHPSNPKNVFGCTFKELAEALGNMRYDAIGEFFDELSSEISHQATADKRRKRDKLSQQLYNVTEHLNNASDSMNQAWIICEPHMEKEENV